jgi:hypothetical protein
MFIIFARDMNSGVYYCFLQICSSVMQNSIFKKFPFGMQMILPAILNILASVYHTGVLEPLTSVMLSKLSQNAL